MSVDAATVRRIAHLARIAVADDEVRASAGRAQRHPGVRRAAFGGRSSTGVEPMTSVTPMAMKKRAGRGHRRRRSRTTIVRTRRRPRTTTSSCRKWWNRCARPARRCDRVRAISTTVEEAKRKAQPMRIPRRHGAAGQGRRSRQGDGRRARCGSRPPAGRAPTTPPTTRPCLRSSAARSINDRTDLADASPRRATACAEEIFTRARTGRRASRRDREGARAQRLCAGDAGARARDGARPPTRGIAKGEGGPLEGIPLGIKDLFCTEGVRTTACSHILDNFVPTYESTVTRAISGATARCCSARLNNDEFAMGSSNETSCFGPGGQSPWRREGLQHAARCRAARPAARRRRWRRICALGATATDTGGSIRQPAAFTGTVGIKPTYGRCSRWGIVAFASSLDQAGPIARTVRDAAILLRSMAGHDPKDTTSVDIAGAGLRGGGRQVDQGHEDRHPEGIPHRRHAGGDREAVAAGRGMAEGRRRRDRRGVAAAHQIRAAGLLHRGAGGGLVQPRAL